MQLRWTSCCYPKVQRGIHRLTSIMSNMRIWSCLTLTYRRSIQMGKSTKNLKAALKSQQSRLKTNQQRLHASQVVEHKMRMQVQRSSTSLKGKAKQTSIHPPRRPTIPFKSTDTVLLIGEGNFSFARALIQSPALELGLLPNNITATAYDSEQQCYEKYPEAKLIVSDLRSSGMEILFSVDGTCLEKNSSLKGRRWDRVVWNFPHAGELPCLMPWI